MSTIDDFLASCDLAGRQEARAGYRPGHPGQALGDKVCGTRLEVPVQSWKVRWERCWRPAEPHREPPGSLLALGHGEGGSGVLQELGPELPASASGPGRAWQGREEDVKPQIGVGTAGCALALSLGQGVDPGPASGYLTWQGCVQTRACPSSGHPCPPLGSGHLKSYFRCLVGTQPRQGMASPTEPFLPGALACTSW